MSLPGPVCPYDGATAELVDAGAVYGPAFEGRGNAWRCPECWATVGCKRGPLPTPMGTLANPELREFRKRLRDRMTTVIRALGEQRGTGKERLRLRAERERVGWLTLEECRQRLWELYT
jgi:hypothetical protein